MRHRRRCQGPKKIPNRRKACDACVQAKAKCCYTQPTCSRCARRGTPCVYAASSVAPTSDHSERWNEPTDDPNPSIQLPPSEIVNPAQSSQLLEPDLLAWDFSASSYGLESFDLALADLTNTSPAAPQSFTATEPSTNERSEYTPPSQVFSEPLGSGGITPLTPSSIQSAGFTMTLLSSPSLFALVRALSVYPSLLRKGSFRSPFLHSSLYSLYNSTEADMAYLPLTSMAICCGSGINVSADKRFVRRAINAARERLIGTFVSAVVTALCPAEC